MLDQIKPKDLHAIDLFEFMEEIDYDIILPEVSRPTRKERNRASAALSRKKRQFEMAQMRQQLQKMQSNINDLNQQVRSLQQTRLTLQTLCNQNGIIIDQSGIQLNKCHAIM